MDIPAVVFGQLFHIGISEDQPGMVRFGYQKITKVKREYRQKKRSDQIRSQKTPEADTTAQNGHDLRVRSHLGSEKDHRNKGKKIDEQVNEVRNKVQIVVEHNGPKRRLVPDKTVQIFRNIKDDHNDDQQSNGIKKCAQELFDNIDIQDLHLRITIILSLRTLFNSYYYDIL
jgi:hypothetical protein